MKIPAIRGAIGDWTYYVCTLTFRQVATYVEKIDGQLHRSKGLRDLIQRSLTKNFEEIRDYVLNQNERFFNALVLGVYNGIPNWVEVELNFGTEEFFNLGLLDFPGNEKIFPIDGQHRVEGIKAALSHNANLQEEKVAVIFVGHKSDEAGMQRSRRLFTTLNRYAKPVTMDDIIALDEDDTIAIVTRDLLEDFDLFSENRITKSKNKAISEQDKRSLTSIITLYQSNRELLKSFRRKRKQEAPKPERDKKGLHEYLKFRPDSDEIVLFKGYCAEFWNAFIEKTDVAKEYLELSKQRLDQPASKYRNREHGGNLLFRPVGLLPFVQASVEIHKRTGDLFPLIFEKLNQKNLEMESKPWVQVLWNPNAHTMVMGNEGLVKLLLIYLYGDIVKPGELESIKKQYADRISYVGENLENVLDGIR